MQKHISRLVQLSGNGLQSSGLIGVLVKGMRDACMSVPPAYISSCVLKLTHPKAGYDRIVFVGAVVTCFRVCYAAVVCVVSVC